MDGSGLRVLMKLPNPPQMVKDVLLLFANFYRIEGKFDHTWQSVVSALRNHAKIVDGLDVFNYDGVSQAQLKLLRQATLPSPQAVASRSQDLVGVCSLLRCVRDYFQAKAAQ